ncbi:MAG TPA: hypothetical protein VHC97_22620 [Thermoanaerobaculia bacterium]|jgi:hypothetical protein|nr:hypothetical protein [Thermoanaerobaculia bacterium]
MKKKAKRLTLSRETLVNLENSLEQVAGGAYTNNPDICFSGQATCATCVNTCTTNRC